MRQSFPYDVGNRTRSPCQCYFWTPQWMGHRLLHVRVRALMRPNWIYAYHYWIAFFSIFFPSFFFSLDSLTIMMKSPTVCHDVMCGLCSGTNAHFGHATPLAPPQFTEFNSIIEKPNLIKGKKKERMKSLLSDSALHIVRAACTIPLLCCVQMYWLCYRCYVSGRYRIA